MSKPKVHLVLGSGGARGIAHIAVIEELEKEGYEIIEVIGCSMGAVVGGIYAAGQLEEYKSWLINLSRRDVFDLLDFTFTRHGFVKGEKLFAKHLEVTGKFKIEDFRIPFTAVATDMKHNKEVHFTSGPLYKALRASVSIPGFFVPVVDNDRILVDGGVLNPLPINLVHKKDDAIIVAVNLNGPSLPKVDNETLTDKKEPTHWFENLLPQVVQEKIKRKEKPEEEESFSLIGLMDSSFCFIQDRLTELMIEMYKPDKVIEIPRNICGVSDFHHGDEILRIGRASYHAVMNPIASEKAPKEQ